MVEIGPGFASVREGPWQAWSRVGRSTADPYTRAHIARSGRLPVMSKSVLYFTTVRDSNGSKIDSECDYLIAGNDPGRGWWSVAAYDGAGNLMANPAERYTFNADNVLRDPNGRFQISLSKFPMPGNWLPVDSDYQVRLIFRLYLNLKDQETRDQTLDLPNITRVACR